MTMSRPVPVALIADIGGTNARFALVEEGGAIRASQAYRCADFTGPAPAAQAFLTAHGGGMRPDRAAFAVASPIDGDVVGLTNSAWRFSIEQSRQALGLTSLRVINDFTALALSAPLLGAVDKMAIGHGVAQSGAPIAILGPGTGLGVSALVPSADGWIPLSTEGGHVTMAPADEDEDKVLHWLRGRYGHVSAERVLSGGGLVNLYDAACALAGASPAFTDAAAISQAALAGRCPLAKQALDMFFAMLGTVAGNLVLSLGAKGGVYVAGGILPRMADAFQASGFRTRFEAKGRFDTYLAPVPVWLITHPLPAFPGLASLVA